MAEKNKIYFISDVHLGARAFSDDREREQKLVRFLSSIENDAKAISDKLGDALVSSYRIL